MFGGPVREQAEEDKENGLGPSATTNEQQRTEEPPSATGQPHPPPPQSKKQEDAPPKQHQSRPGKEAAADKEEAVAKHEEEGDDAQEEQGEQEQQEEGDGDGDMQLAWENLETARAIWARDANTNAADLASVHTLLGEVNMENEAFDDALADFDAALQHQATAGIGNDDRRHAEVHFQRSLVLQFLSRPEEALEAVKLAIDAFSRCKEKKVACGEDANGLESVLDEMKEREEELKAEVAEAAATKAAMKGAMQQLQAAMAAKAGNVLTAQRGSGGTARAAGAGGTSATTPVKDLGVVGRGTKRINLAPVGVDAGNTALVASKEEEGHPKKKRSLEGLMGGAGSDVGFGGGENKPKEVGNGGGGGGEQPLPAFLQTYKKDS